MATQTMKIPLLYRVSSDWMSEQVYEGCPSKSWTFVITRDCVPVTL